MHAVSVPRDRPLHSPDRRLRQLGGREGESTRYLQQQQWQPQQEAAGRPATVPLVRGVVSDRSEMLHRFRHVCEHIVTRDEHARVLSPAPPMIEPLVSLRGMEEDRDAAEEQCVERALAREGERARESQREGQGRVQGRVRSLALRVTLSPAGIRQKVARQ